MTANPISSSPRISHQITNVLVEVGPSGEEAASEAYVTVALWTVPDSMGTVTQVTSRYQRPLEYADLRHNDGYAVRLKGITTVLTPSKDKK